MVHCHVLVRPGLEKERRREKGKRENKKKKVKKDKKEKKWGRNPAMKSRLLWSRLMCDGKQRGKKPCKQCSDFNLLGSFGHDYAYETTRSPNLYINGKY